APDPCVSCWALGRDVGARASEGRRREFGRFREFGEPAARQRIPDPQAESTRDRSVLDWKHVAEPQHAEWLAFHRELLEVRAREIAPLLRGEPVLESRASLMD